jgi:hypothetical protein
MTENVLGEAADSANRAESAGQPVHNVHTDVHTSDRRAYYREQKRRQRVKAKGKPPAPPDDMSTMSTANAIKAAWNDSPPPVREEFMVALGRMRAIRDDFA